MTLFMTLQFSIYYYHIIATCGHIMGTWGQRKPVWLCWLVIIHAMQHNVSGATGEKLSYVKLRKSQKHDSTDILDCVKTLPFWP